MSAFGNLIVWHKVLASGLIFVLVFACSCSERQPRPSEIKIGATLPLTGDAAVWGNNTKEGIELALAEINAVGGVLGQKIAVVYEDTEALPGKGVNAYHKLIQVDKVQAIIDDSVSSVTLAMAPLAQRDRVVILATGATAPKISEAGEFIFRIWNSDVYEGRLAAKYAAGELKLVTCAILFINNDYGKGLEEVFRIEFAKLGGKVVESESFEQNSTDLRSQITKTKALNPGGLYIIGYPKEIPIALKQIKELGLKAKLIGTVAMNDLKLIETAGDAAEGLVFPCSKEPGGEYVQKFKKSFRSMYDKEPGIAVDVGYDAMNMIAEAIRRSGGSSGESIRKGLNMLTDFPGASGVMTFDEKGDVHKPMGMKMVRGGQFIWLG